MFVSPPSREQHTGTSETTSLTTPLYTDGKPRPGEAKAGTDAHLSLGASRGGAERVNSQRVQQLGRWEPLRNDAPFGVY